MCLPQIQKLCIRKDRLIHTLLIPLGQDEHFRFFWQREPRNISYKLLPLQGISGCFWFEGNGAGKETTRSGFDNREISLPYLPNSQVGGLRVDFLIFWVNFPFYLSLLPWGLQDGYSDSEYYVFTQQGVRERTRHGFSLDSLLRISELFSCIPQLTYPHVLLARFIIFAKPHTNHWQGGRNHFDWIHGNLPPWGWGGPQAPLKHMAAWYAVKIERECLLGRQPTVFATQGKLFRKGFNQNFLCIRVRFGYSFLLALSVLLLNDPKWNHILQVRPTISLDQRSLDQNFPLWYFKLCKQYPVSAAGLLLPSPLPLLLLPVLPPLSSFFLLQPFKTI